MYSWVAKQHALSPESIGDVQTALSLGWVTGFHYFLGGGDGPRTVVFTTYDEYDKDISDARPGDKFVLWSIGKLLQQGKCLLAVSSTGNNPLRSQRLVPEDLAKIREYLAMVPNPQEFANEILVSARVGEGVAMAFVADIDRIDEVNDVARQVDGAGGELYILPLREIEAPELCLLNVKRPNELGEVPLIGSY